MVVGIDRCLMGRVGGCSNAASSEELVRHSERYSSSEHSEGRICRSECRRELVSSRVAVFVEIFFPRSHP
ncbi:hypothetical protein R1flu_026548 [Riccia fluitans]|uniref:Uncharacterized protein n=1 Tax=Riccia fluitans TaxID=41844 RepID=A0ABD1XGS0_9MARC